MTQTAFMALALTLSGCGEDAPEPVSEPRTEQPEPVAPPPSVPDEPPDDSWYTLILPANAAFGRHDQEEVIDAVYIVDPVTLTVLVPIPGQRDLDAWSATVSGLFADEPVLAQENGSVGSVAAIVQQTQDSLRWIFVSDGFGVIVKCFSAEPHDRVWLHEHCDPLMGEMSLRLPVHD